METKHIQEFITLAELGSSYAAAEKLFVSQSTLLRHIQAIEEEFGKTLFDRSKKGFCLNESGEIFLRFAKKMVMMQALCYQELNQEEKEERVLHLCAQGKIIDLLVGFKKEYPDYVIDYHKCERYLEELRSGKVEIAFLSNLGAAPEGLIAIPCYQEEVLVVCYEGHPLAQRKSVALEELRDERFVTLSEDIVFDDAFLELFSKTGFTQNIAASVPVGSDVLRLVSEKIGICMIHGVLETMPLFPGLRYVPLEPRLKYNVMMCYKNDVPLSRAGAQFVNYAKKWMILHKDVNPSLLNSRPEYEISDIL